MALILFPYIGHQIYADEELNEAVLSADSVNVPLQTSTLHIDNLTCESCVISVRKSLRTVPGIARAQVDLETGLAEITYDLKLVSVDELTAAIGKAGYSASPQKEALHE